MTDIILKNPNQKDRRTQHAASLLGQMLPLIRGLDKSHRVPSFF